jgi:hypothetical protein
VLINRALAIVFALHLGCGSGSQPTTTPTPPPQVVRLQGTGTVPPPDAGGRAGYAQAVTFSTTQAATLEVLLDWTVPTDVVEPGLFQGICLPESFYSIPSRCSGVVGATTSTSGKPRRLSVSSLPAGSYAVGVLNRGPLAEAYAYEITIR